MYLTTSEGVTYMELFHIWSSSTVDHACDCYYESMQKTSQFKKGDISHAFETAKITVFYPTLCKTPDVPLQNELLC